MTRSYWKSGIAIGTVILAYGGLAQARTDAETKAIVLKFDAASFAKPDPAVVDSMLADDFADHAGTVLDRTKYLGFIKQLAGRKGKGPSMMASKPNLVLAHGDYVLFMTERNSPDPTATGKTYVSDSFDLFRVNADGKIAEHWDSFEKVKMKPGARFTMPTTVKEDLNAKHPQASSRSDAQTLAIVQKFSADAWSPKGDKQALAGELADDFFEHHPPSGTPEATKAEFLQHFGPSAPKFTPPAGLPTTMPAPVVTQVFGHYALILTKQVRPDPTAEGKTYDWYEFDLFRVNDQGQVAEHWDDFTKAAK